MTSRWPPRIAAFLLWALAAGTAVYWLLRVVGMSESRFAADTVAEPAPAISVADLAAALGPATVVSPGAQAVSTQASAPDRRARMRLLGVVTGRKSGGVALISIDGQIARPYRVGSQIDDAYRLTKVEKGSATLSPMQSTGAAITLELQVVAMPVVGPRPIGAAGPVGRRFGELPANPAVATPPAGAANETAKQ